MVNWHVQKGKNTLHIDVFSWMTMLEWWHGQKSHPGELFCPSCSNSWVWAVSIKTNTKTKEKHTISTLNTKCTHRLSLLYLSSAHVVCFIFQFRHHQMLTSRLSLWHRWRQQEATEGVTETFWWWVFNYCCVCFLNQNTEELSIKELYERIDMLSEESTKYSAPNEVINLLFPSVNEITSHFSLLDERKISYMGRECFSQVWKTFRIIVNNPHQHQAIYLFRGKGLGKSHILAALVCFLVRRAHKLSTFPIVVHGFLILWDIFKMPLSSLL